MWDGDGLSKLQVPSPPWGSLPRRGVPHPWPTELQLERPGLAEKTKQRWGHTFTAWPCAGFQHVKRVKWAGSSSCFKDASRVRVGQWHSETACRMNHQVLPILECWLWFDVGQFLLTYGPQVFICKGTEQNLCLWFLGTISGRCCLWCWLVTVLTLGWGSWN